MTQCFRCDLCQTEIEGRPNVKFYDLANSIYDEYCTKCGEVVTAFVKRRRNECMDAGVVLHE